MRVKLKTVTIIVIMTTAMESQTIYYSKLSATNPMLSKRSSTRLHSPENNCSSSPMITECPVPQYDPTYPFPGTQILRNTPRSVVPGNSGYNKQNNVLKHPHPGRHGSSLTPAAMRSSFAACSSKSPSGMRFAELCSICAAINCTWASW